VTAFLDSAVFMYAGGGPHSLKAPCQSTIGAAMAETLDATTSVEVVQEILHRYRAIGRPAQAVEMATLVLDAFGPVLPVTHAVMRRTALLARRYPGMSARDLVHVATCIVEGIDTIISPDAGFDQVMEIRRVDPREFGASS
jgi:predicted nucleic acid-binding protein